MIFNIDYEIASLVFALVFIVTMISKRDYDEYSRKAFMTYFVLGVIDVILDIVTSYTDSFPDRYPMVLDYTLNTMFLIMQAVIPTFLIHYVYMKASMVEDVSKELFIGLTAPAAMTTLILLTNGFTHAVFYFEDGEYYHGPIYMIVYGSAIFYFFASIALTFFLRDILGKRQCQLNVIITLTAFVPVGIQMLLQTVLLTGLAVMLFIFLMYFTNESQMVYEDTVTDALNRNAFLKHINDSFRKKRDENLFVIALDNFKIVNEVVGIDGGNEIMIMLVDNLQEEYGVRNVFRWGGDVFIVTVPVERESSRDAEIIRRIIQMPYFVKSSMLELGACICLLDTSDMDKDKIAWTIEFAVGKVKNKGKGSYVVIDKSIEQDIRRSVAIEQAIHNSIMNGSFEVHYQPIYDTAHKKIHSMEALARLNVPEFGYVSPEEFIRVAEKNGTIFQIGILVIEEVCKFIKEYDLKKYGIEFVEINLSVVQCMKEHINTDITEAIDKYGIPHDMINLEITESAAGDSEEKLIRTMAQLALSDFTFSLDDYGSGYSNINYIVDLPFSIVKIDKYVVWAALKDASSRKILENTVKMFKDVHLQIVAEGVEDLDMANILIDMGVDYLQGYYYSKPVPKDKFVDFIREKSYEKIS